MPELSIIIVSFNTRDLLRKCLESVETAAADINHEIIVVDNASSDDSVGMVRSYFSNIKVHENDQNVGFSRAVNQGIKSSSNAGFIALINSDTVIPKDTFTKFVDYLKKNDKVAMVGPQLVGKDGRMQDSAGYKPSLEAALRQIAGWGALRGTPRGLRIRAKPKEGIQSVDWLAGTCVVIKQKAIDQAGLLDDKQFMYAEDIEYGLRLRRAGWQLHLLPNVRVVHFGGASSTTVAHINLLWLGSYFCIASSLGQLKGFRYCLFGLFLTTSFFVRFLAVLAMKLTSQGRQRFKSKDLELFAYTRTALQLSLHNTKYAYSFCSELEAKYRGSSLKGSI